jgi:ABC-2 type transport system ATP-binding protein
MSALLEAKGIEKAYGGRPALGDLDLSMASSEMLGLIGPNGAGKTTLLRILLGLIRPDKGSIAWTGCQTSSVGHFGGGHTVPPGAVASKWAELVSRGKLRSTENRRVRALSRGTRQMLGLQATLSVTDFRAVLLDEPWEGLDPDGSRWLSQTLQFRRKEGCAFILSSHRLYDLAGLCDRYAFLIDGKLVTRTAAEIRPAGSVTGPDLLETFDKIRISS